MVIRVDKDKGYIDLSKRRVSKEDIERCTEKYSKAKAVNSIVRHVAEILGFKNNDELEELYKKTAWYFESKSKKQVNRKMSIRRCSTFPKYFRARLTTTSSKLWLIPNFWTLWALRMRLRLSYLRTSRGSSPSRRSRSALISNALASRTRGSMQ